jgi:hypothetical protein
MKGIAMPFFAMMDGRDGLVLLIPIVFGLVILTPILWFSAHLLRSNARRDRITGLSLVGMCFFLGIAAFRLALPNRENPPNDMKLWLAGSEDVRITSLEIMTAQANVGRIIVSDRESADYLTQTLRRLSGWSCGASGHHFDATLSLSSGGAIHCNLGLPELPGPMPATTDARQAPFAFLGNPFPDPPTISGIPLPKPIPEPLSHVFEQLR